MSYIAQGLANVRLPLPGSIVIPTTHHEPPKPVEKPVEREVGVWDDVKCIFGRGRVLAIRDDGVYVVKATDWWVARDCRAMFYLQKGSVQWVRPKYPFEMSVREIIAAAEDYKARAGEAFNAGKVDEACEYFQKVITYLQSQGQGSGDRTSFQRAKTLELLIPSQNSASICYFKQKKYVDAATAAENAAKICELLDSDHNTAVMKILCRLPDMTETKVGVLWRRKALYLQGKAILFQNEPAEALIYLKKAFVLAKSVKAPSPSDEKSVGQLINQAREKLKAQEKKEKELWKQAFAKNADADAEPQPAVPTPVGNGLGNGHEQQPAGVKTTAAKTSPKRARSPQRQVNGTRSLDMSAGVGNEDGDESEYEEEEEVVVEVPAEATPKLGKTSAGLVGLSLVLFVVGGAIFLSRRKRT